jgi:hypothetical protein
VQVETTPPIAANRVTTIGVGMRGARCQPCQSMRMGGDLLDRGFTVRDTYTHPTVLERSRWPDFDPLLTLILS